MSLICDGVAGMLVLNNSLRRASIMKEYKIVEVKKAQAEKTMNEMAKQGWEVVSFTAWNNWRVSIMIAFSRDV